MKIFRSGNFPEKLLFLDFFPLFLCSPFSLIRLLSALNPSDIVKDVQIVVKHRVKNDLPRPTDSDSSPGSASASAHTAVNVNSAPP